MPEIRPKRVEYRARHKALGLCIKCTSDAVPRSDRCFRHWMIYTLMVAGLTKGVLPPKAKAKRELLIAGFSGRYFAILNGFLEPSSYDASLTDVMSMRTRLKINWCGDAGIRKLATILRNVENRAFRLRKERGTNA